MTVNVGDTAVFISGATGVPTPDLQWYKNGTALPGQTGSTLDHQQCAGIRYCDLYTCGQQRRRLGHQFGGQAHRQFHDAGPRPSLPRPTEPPASAMTRRCMSPSMARFQSSTPARSASTMRPTPTTPVDTIDMSSNTVVVSGGINLTNNIQPHSLFSGDSQVINYFPVIISGNTAAIYPHGGVMTSNQTYYVTMDNGIVADSTGAYFAGISDTNAWRFTTKADRPGRSDQPGCGRRWQRRFCHRPGRGGFRSSWQHHLHASSTSTMATTWKS